MIFQFFVSLLEKQLFRSWPGPRGVARLIRLSVSRQRGERGVMAKMQFTKRSFDGTNHDNSDCVAPVMRAVRFDGTKGGKNVMENERNFSRTLSPSAAAIREFSSGAAALNVRFFKLNCD